VFSKKNNIQFALKFIILNCSISESGFYSKGHNSVSFCTIAYAYSVPEWIIMNNNLIFTTLVLYVPDSMGKIYTLPMFDRLTV